jgi:glucosamine--fructose-6-phosphate aminotransferase (isomerizing)
MIYDGDAIKLCKTKGKVVDLEERASKEITTNGTIGIGHTRWATMVFLMTLIHILTFLILGLVIIHNGIIEITLH